MARILVIEDDETCRLLVRLVLEYQGYTVVEAANGAEGLRQYATAPTALVVTDMQMPEMDGLQVLQALRHMRSPVPVIALSGDTATLTAAQAFTPYTVVKPFQTPCLLALVRTLLAASSSLTPGRDSTP